MGCRARGSACRIAWDVTRSRRRSISPSTTPTRFSAQVQRSGWSAASSSSAGSSATPRSRSAQMGIDQPNFGPLTDAMLVAHDGTVSPALIQPRVEPEIGLRFDRSLPADANLDEVLGAVGEAFACLEIVDSVYPDYRFRLEDNTADGSSAAQVVVGPALSSIDRLDEVTVELLHNGMECGSATGRAASGHPAAGVVWLVSQLALQGLHVEAGHIVITGGLTRAVPLDFGDHVEAVFDDETRVRGTSPTTPHPRYQTSHLGPTGSISATDDRPHSVHFVPMCPSHLVPASYSDVR